ncbi:MAG TPA: hypothetical protein VFX49_22835, partial [Chloroflexota bacterium]|nr:hypothetical protein [Chloroflexota bacterium]
MIRRREALAMAGGAALAVRPRAAGAQWRPAGLAGTAIQRVVPDRANEGVLYASGAAAAGGAGRTAFYKSLDAGRSWFTIERGLPLGFVPTALAVSPESGRVALAG